MHQKIKAYFHEITTIHSSPNEIAVGFAVGAFIGILPTPGFSILLGVLVVFLYPRISKLALFGSLALFNPLVVIPFNILSYKIGSWLFGGQPVVTIDLSYIATIYQYSRRYLVGNFIVALGTALISYPIVYGVAHYYKKRKNASTL